MTTLKSLVVRLSDRVAAAVQNARLNHLDPAERRAVVRLLHDIAVADGVLSSEEQALLETTSNRLNVSLADIKQLALDEAVDTLAVHNGRSLRFACLVVADAFFVDGDYDAQEKAFVASFQERFGLPHNPLKDAVETLRQHKLDDALQEWNASIQSAGA